MQPLLDALYAGSVLSHAQAAELFDTVVRGECDPVVLGAALAALKVRGERSCEIAGAASALRAHALAFPRPSYAFADTAGTGGDGLGTLNVSTAAALVLAECGLPVAKHGNRKVSSRSGSADVLERAGMRLDPPPAIARRMLDETGFCFLFAPQYHAGIAHAVPVRNALRTRTLFNLLGPLLNPAGPDVQLVGVYDARLCRVLADTLRQLGCRTALVVHGGVDEVALHGPTHAALLRDGTIAELTLEPEQGGITRRPLDDIAGGDAAFNARALERVLAGDAECAYADAIALNAGALLWAAGRADSFAAGCARARAALGSGGAGRRLRRAVEIGNGR